LEVDAFSSGVSHFNAGELTLSEISLTEYLNSFPNHFEALQLLGIINDMKGNYEKSTQLFRHALSIQPNASDCWANLGNSYISLYQYADAVHCFNQAISINKNSIEAIYGLSIAHSKNRNYELALNCYEKLLDLGGLDNPQIANGIGIVLTQLKRYDEALIYYKKIREGMQVPPEVFCNEGIAYKGLKQYPSALASYQQAIALDPQYAQAWYNQGATLHDLGRYDEALASYDRAIQIYPAYAQAWSNKGVTFSCMGQPQRALEFLKKSQSLDPHYPDAGWNLSLINLLLGRFVDGWKTHECRWKKDDPHPYLHPEYPQLNSLNELAGKKILVWS
jgi:tetratricopeptide (TPR) repeat protein